nr:xylulose kinase-1 [Tanacetum cinerariifolium]
MTLTFAGTYNMVAYLNKSDASKGFNQIIDFLNGSYIEYALTVNPTVYVSCIKQFWNTVAVKQSNDVTRLQALVDKKKVVVTEAAIRDALRLDDAEGVDCLPNEGFLLNWLAWNQLGDLSTHSTRYTSPALTQKVFVNIRRVGKGCSRVETPLFKGMLITAEPEEQGDADEEMHVPPLLQSIPSPAPLTPPPQQPQDIPPTSQAQSPPPQPQSPTPAQPKGADFPMSLLQEALDACAALTRRVEHLEHDKVAQDLEIIKLKTRVKKLERANKVKALKLRRLRKVGTSQRVDTSNDTIIEDEEVEVVTTAKLITEVVAAVSETVSAAAVVPTVTVAPVKSKEKGKGIMVEEPKPMKKKKQVELDEAYARKLHEELNQDINWEVAIDHVKQKAKENPYVQRYQVMKKRPQTKAQARRNMMMYLKNTSGFRLDYFKGMSYDDIRPIFEAKFNANMEFLLKSKEQIEEEANRALESINETPAQKVAKRRRMNEEVKDIEEIKQHLEIVPDEDDDVYTEATPLARKVPVIDYQIIHFNNKPHYKIICADGTHQLYVSIISLLKNFDREDLESLCSIVKERFSTSKPNNFFDDYLLITLRAMFERPDGQD